MFGHPDELALSLVFDVLLDKPRTHTLSSVKSSLTLARELANVKLELTELNSSGQQRTS